VIIPAVPLWAYLRSAFLELLVLDTLREASVPLWSFHMLFSTSGSAVTDESDFSTLRWPLSSPWASEFLCLSLAARAAR